MGKRQPQFAIEFLEIEHAKREIRVFLLWSAVAYHIFIDRKKKPTNTLPHETEKVTQKKRTIKITQTAHKITEVRLK